MVVRDDQAGRIDDDARAGSRRLDACPEEARLRLQVVHDRDHGWADAADGVCDRRLDLNVGLNRGHGRWLNGRLRGGGRRVGGPQDDIRRPGTQHGASESEEQRGRQQDGDKCDASGAWLVHDITLRAIRSAQRDIVSRQG